MTVSDRIRGYLDLLMNQTFGFHHELDKIALTFGLDPTRTTIKGRCHRYAYEIPDERFHELAEYVLNYEAHHYEFSDLPKLREGFVRALRLEGFRTGYNGVYEVEPNIGLERLEVQKKETKTMLEEYDFNEVQTDLDAAEAHYVKGDYAQSLTMARKALEDLFSSMGQRIGVDRKNFLSAINSGSARDLIKNIYGYGCKGHELNIPEYEAIFGYHLIVSSIYFILILFKNDNINTSPN